MIEFVLKGKGLCLFFVLLLLFMSSTESCVEASVDVVESSTENSSYHYSPVGRRDPFVPLIREIRNDSNKVRRNLGPLEKFELSQFRLVAMMVIQGSPRAMVESPDGSSYTVKLGDLIGPNGGVVKQIKTKVIEVDGKTGQRIEKSPDRIVIEEKGVDTFTGRAFKETRYLEM